MKLGVTTLLAALCVPAALAGYIGGVTCTTMTDCPFQLPCLSGRCYIYDHTVPSPVPPTPTSQTGSTPMSTPNPSTAATMNALPVSDSAGLGSSVTGDPQFIGLDGRLFDFDGEPDKVFNLLSEPSHQLNALFVAGPHKTNRQGIEAQGTFLGAFGLKAYRTVLILKVDETGYMTVNLNGHEISRDELRTSDFAKKVDLEDNVLVVIEEFREGLGQAVTVITPLFEFLIFPTDRQWDPQLNQTARGHLNLALSVELEEVKEAALHGILGQTHPSRTLPDAKLPTELERMFLGEGQALDYIVSDLLADDFIFNQYDASYALHERGMPARYIGATSRRLASSGEGGCFHRVLRRLTAALW